MKMELTTGRIAIVMTETDCHYFHKGTVVMEIYEEVPWTDRKYWWMDSTGKKQAMLDSDLLIINGGKVRY